MGKPLVPTLEELFALVQEQNRTINSMCEALDIQFKRTAQLQAELDGLPHAKRRRADAFRSFKLQPLVHHGDGNEGSERRFA